MSQEDAGKEDPSAEETVFSASMSPCELYQELVSSYNATCVVDVSPGQGEFLKACLPHRTKAVCICGTDAHASKLEMLLTAFILTELSREGSTYYRADSVAKDEEDKVADLRRKSRGRQIPRRRRKSALGRATTRRRSLSTKKAQRPPRKSTRRKRSKRRTTPKRTCRRTMLPRTCGEWWSEGAELISCVSRGREATHFDS